VSRSGFHAWLNCPTNARLSVKIKKTWYSADGYLLSVKKCEMSLQHFDRTGRIGWNQGRPSFNIRQTAGVSPDQLGFEERATRWAGKHAPKMMGGVHRMAQQ
jgi:hypothetical protein